jgi:hypothetical protein
VRARALRVILAILAVFAAGPGLQGSFAPRGFYTGFPAGRGWVELLPPYNEHLIRDVGGFYLAFAILFAWAAVTPARQLVLPLCVAWSVAALLHFVYHATHLDGFSTSDAIAQTTGLAFVLGAPLAAIWLSARPRPVPLARPAR